MFVNKFFLWTHAAVALNCTHVKHGGYVKDFGERMFKECACYVLWC